jgi:hypothetical protein
MEVECQKAGDRTEEQATTCPGMAIRRSPDDSRSNKLNQAGFRKRTASYTPTERRNLASLMKF